MEYQEPMMEYIVFQSNDIVTLSGIEFGDDESVSGKDLF